MAMTSSEIKAKLEGYARMMPQKVDINVPVKVNARLTATLGRVRYKVNAYTGETVPVSIEFSKLFLETANQQEIDDIIKHEFAHFYTSVTYGNHGHRTPEFKAACATLDCEAEASAKLSTETMVKRAQVHETKIKYKMICPGCGKVVATFQRNCKTVDLAKLGVVTSKCCKRPVAVIEC